MERNSRKIPWRTLLWTLVVNLAIAVPCGAVVVGYDLTIAGQQVNISGRPAEAMTVNGGIPGPTLRFKEGDTARIQVKNDMAVETSIHWHGVLVPPGMDGVPYISFPPLAPGASFTYEFPIRQSGTYWYHSHSGLQEQRGVYGSIVIEPGQGGLRPERDHVVLLSDWTDENPESVNRTLKRGSEWYSLEKGSGQSILGAARIGMLGNYLKREFMRMPPMDIADVAYDRFLANGAVESMLMAKPGETIRLRIINGSATTYFHVEFGGGPMTIVAADGVDVAPLPQERLLIAVAETYDALVSVPASGSYEFRATAHDGSGYSSVWIGSGPRHPARDVPKPNLYHSMHPGSLTQALALTPAGSMGMTDTMIKMGMFDNPGMMSMEHDSMQEMALHGEQPGAGQMERMQPLRSKGSSEGMKQMSPGSPMQMQDGAGKHAMGATSSEMGSPRELDSRDRSGKKYGTDFGFLSADIASQGALAVDGMDKARPWPPYDKLRATEPTAFPDGRKVKEFRLALDGDMERYIWSFNDKTLAESDFIRIREGEVARFILINRTMMHHPIHLHGHFFRVVGDQGSFAPLKHTVDVAPMSTTVIEFAANEAGDWLFHCHLLYHMKAGMTRVVHYEGFTVEPGLAATRSNLAHDPWYFWGNADLLSNMTEGLLTLSNTRNIVTAFWEVGWGNVDTAEWEGLLAWDRSINRFFTVFAGIDLLGEDTVTEEIRGVAGFHYLLPFNLDSRFLVDTDGGIRIDLEKSLALTPRLALFGEARYDTHDLWEGKAGLSYLICNNTSATLVWHSDYAWGAGLKIRF